MLRAQERRRQLAAEDRRNWASLPSPAGRIQKSRAFEYDVETLAHRAVGLQRDGADGESVTVQSREETHEEMSAVGETRQAGLRPPGEAR